jgi:fructose-1,6-bisphosphatase/inositol monophosphatase family enzyme
MDFDKNQFLSDLFESLLKMPGDPVTQIDRAVEDVIASHVKVLKRLAQHYRQDLLDMAEEHRTTGHPVVTRWKA